MDLHSASLEQLKQTYLSEVRDKNLAKNTSDEKLLNELESALSELSIEEARVKIISIIQTYKTVSVPEECPYCKSPNYYISSTYKDYYFCSDCGKGDPII